MIQLYHLLKNTVIFCGIFFKKSSLWFLSLFRCKQLLKRYDISIDVSSPVAELPKNSWHIRNIVLTTNSHSIIDLADQLSSIVLSVRAQFPNKTLTIDCDQSCDFRVSEFLQLLSGDSLESKLDGCMTIGNFLVLQGFLEQYPFVKLVRSRQSLSSIILNKKISLAWFVIILGITGVCWLVFFSAIYDKNLQSVSQVKELSQQLLQVVDDKNLSDVQKFQLFQDYYFFSREFLRSHTVFVYSVATPLPQSMRQLLFTVIKKHYNQRMIKDLKEKLVSFNSLWGRHKIDRGEYYAYWLAYLDLLYPDHIAVAAIDFQLRTLMTDISQFAVSPDFVDGYLQYLKDAQRLPTVLLADDFFLSIKHQLQQQYNEDLVALIYFLDIKKSGVVSLDYFLKHPDILLSTQPLPAIFLKENFLHDLLPQLKEVSQHAQDYTWFIDQAFQGSDLLFDALKQKFTALDKQSWRDFLSAVRIRPTTSLLLASNFLTMLMQDKGDFNRLLVSATNNLEIVTDNNQLNRHWRDYKKALEVLYEDSHYLLLNDDVSIAAKEYAMKVLTTDDAHLNGVEQQVRGFAEDVPDPELAVGLQHYFLAPLKFYWSVLLANARETINQRYQTQVLSYYQQFLQHKFPFTQGAADADPEAVKQWLTPKSGLFWQFLRNDLKGFVVFNNTWQRNTWLGIGLPIQDQFFNKANQLWQFANAVFKQDGYHLDLSLYPIPSPLIENESLTINDAVFFYQNGPQTWQSFVWLPDSTENRLTIQYVDQEAVFRKKFSGSWGLLRFLSETHLEKPSLSLLVKPDGLVPSLQGLQRENDLVLDV